MKKMTKIITWALLSIMMQCAVLLFLDKVYFKHSSEFEISEISTDTSVKDVSINIPSDAEKIKVSYDGKYVSYFIGDKFYINDTKNDTSKEIITDEDSNTVMYAEWLPDRNRVTIAEKIKNDSGQTVVNIISYDAKSGSKYQLKELSKYSSGMKVEGIATTTLSGVSYVGINKGGNSSSIYRIDINDDMKNIGVKLNGIAALKIFPHKDVLLYEDAGTKKFYYYKNGTSNLINTGTYSNLELLAVDNKDVVYMGETSNKKITKIIYGTLDTDISTWQTLNLEKAKEPNDINIDENGEILINDNLEGTITNMSTGSKVSYSGKYITANSKVVMSSDNDQTYIKSLSETE
ncbi:MAG: dipeptidyl-peptidase IV [Clostridium sp.]|uniref:hypothetical protein n=1 Tax=Clostridium sp. DSM 8431 TaxID=1761781 RepID=UPI0008F0E04D|nr:hypothetical protein [Clostridium sp. DSM 8431]MCR4943269.1 dipeptidyl-peptidase IV [Clostridium sp.]SFU75082.1 hypothetical protein SAMN04487886_11342 [Clostridium sp. DSM 8431]